MSSRSKCFIPQPYHLVTGTWDAYINGTDGILNISSVKFNGSILGTLQISNNSAGPGKFCSMSEPCNIIGTFNTKTGKLNFESHPTRESIKADIQNYTGYESSQIHGIDTVRYKLDGIGKTLEPIPIPVKEFGWDASKKCIVRGPVC